MALPPDRYMAARHHAAFHVTVAVRSAALVEPTPGAMRVEGVVVEVYRTDGRLQAGDPVRFGVDVCRPDDSLPCGGTQWKPHDLVATARHIEAFLNGDPPGCPVALWQCQVVPPPAGRPRLSGWHPEAVARLERRAAAARPWWRLLGW